MRPGPHGRWRACAEGLGRLPGVVSVRGAGLLLAAQLVDAGGQGGLRARRSTRGLLVNPVRPDAIRVAPPLLVHAEELDSALGILDDVLTEIVAGAGD